MLMYDESGIFLKEYTRLVAVEFQCREAKVHSRGCSWRVSDV